MVLKHHWTARLSLLLKHIKDSMSILNVSVIQSMQTIPCLCPWNSYEQKYLLGIFLSLQNPFTLENHAEKNLRAISEDSREMYKILCEAECGFWFVNGKTFLAVVFKLHWHTPLFCISSQNYKQHYRKVPVGRWNLLWWAMSALVPGEISTPPEVK